MPKISNRQVALKPQDLYVLLALLSRSGAAASYPELAEQTGLAVSAVHGALKRAAVARLAIFEERRPVVLKPQLRGFVLFGAKYVFPPVWGTLTRGGKAGGGGCVSDFEGPPRGGAQAAGGGVCVLWREVRFPSRLGYAHARR